MLPGGLADPAGIAAFMPRLTELLLRVAGLQEAQRLALVVCAVAASEGDVSFPLVPWRNLFLTLDEDIDGQLSCEDLSEGLRRFAPEGQLQAERMEEAAMALDLDKNGFVDWTEFLAIALIGCGAVAETPEPIATAYRLLDRHEAEDAGAADAMALACELRSFLQTAAASAAEAAAEAKPMSKRLALTELRSVLHSVDPFEMMM